MLSPRLYYRHDLKKLYKHILPKGTKLILKKALLPSKKYDFLVLENVIGDIDDVQKYLEDLKVGLVDDSRLIVIYYNHLWEPVLRVATALGWRRSVNFQNWLSDTDIKNILELAGYELITSYKRFLLPIELPFVSAFINRYIASLPVINNFCLTTINEARLIGRPLKELSVSIIIPARNESGNIKRAIDTLPILSNKQELIFVEGHSKDDTWLTINKSIKSQKRKFEIYAFQQKGIGKADAVRLGFEKAKYDLLMILDADLTVEPKELTKFYELVKSGKAEYVQGSRLVYPMEDEAMRFLNKIGNKMFGMMFTAILGQNIKDTLCGTKVLRSKHYKDIAANRSYFGDFDPFGDFDLIFGAVRLGLKLKEVPIRYKQRIYGSTNISRFKHGLLLLKMTLFAFRKFRAY